MELIGLIVVHREHTSVVWCEANKPLPIIHIGMGYEHSGESWNQKRPGLKPDLFTSMFI